MSYTFRPAIVAIENQARADERRRIAEALSDPERFGWQGAPTYAIAYAAAIRDVKAFLMREPDGVRSEELRDRLHAAIDDCETVGWDPARTTDLRPEAVRAAIDLALGGVDP